MNESYTKLLHVIFYGRKRGSFIEVKESDIERMVKEVDTSLNTLTQRETEILNLYFGLKVEKPLTLEGIGARYNLTRERIRQIKEEAIRRLRHPSRSMNLREYLNE